MCGILGIKKKKRGGEETGYLAEEELRWTAVTVVIVLQLPLLPLSRRVVGSRLLLEGAN